MSQQSQLKFMLNTQFIYLGNIADYVAKEDSLMCEKKIRNLFCMTQDTLFHAISIIDTDGNGMGLPMMERTRKSGYIDYFKRTMKGEEVLSDPLYSSLDGKRRVVLSVPIKKNGEIIGAVAGSFDMVKLSQILFEDVYQGKGYPIITTWEGKIIAINNPMRPNICRMRIYLSYIRKNPAETEKDWNRQDKISNFTEKTV